LAHIVSISFVKRSFKLTIWAIQMNYIIIFQTLTTTYDTLQSKWTLSKLIQILTSILNSNNRTSTLMSMQMKKNKPLVKHFCTLLFLSPKRKKCATFVYSQLKKETTRIHKDIRYGRADEHPQLVITSDRQN
jgi:hypothetical protein